MKRIVALLMIGMLIFSISACSENTGSDVSSQTTSNTNDFSSVNDTVSNTSDINNVSSVIESSSNVSSDVTSSRPTINYEGTSVTPPDPDKIAEVSSRTNTIVLVEGPSPYYGDSHIILHISPEVATKIGDITVESLSKFFEIKVEEIQKINIDKSGATESVAIYFTIIDGDDTEKLEEATKLIEKNKYTMVVYSKSRFYVSFS